MPVRRTHELDCLAAASASCLLLTAAGGASGATGTRLAQTRPGWANPGRERGRADGAQQLSISVWLRWRNAGELASELQSQTDPNSPEYRQWLTPDQFESRFSPTPAQVASVAGWLRGQGLRIDPTPTNRLFVTATGTVAQVEAALSVSENSYRVDGRSVIAPGGDPMIPSGLAGDVQTITGLDGGDTLATPMHTGPAPPPPAGRSAPPCSSYWGEKTSTAFANPYHPGQPLPWVVCGYTPAQIASAYGYAGLHAGGIDGRGVTIAITGAFSSPTILRDADHFAREFGLPRLDGRSFRQVSPPGRVRYPKDPAETQSWYVEQALDVEWAHAAAPGARIVYVAARNDVRGLDQALDYTVDHRLGDVVSNSWGEPEALMSRGEARALNSIFEQAAAEGMTVLFASGDYGDGSPIAGAPSPDLPATSPWVTAVGGTSLAVGSSGQALWQSAWGTTDSTWDGSGWSPNAPGDFYFGGGGGFSTDFARPWFQAAAIPAGPAGRAIPDISLDADPQTGAVFSQTYRWPSGRTQIIDSWIGGTSLSTPLMAGIAAMADQRTGEPVGFLDPALYRLAGSPAILDVTAGHRDDAVLRNRYLPGGQVATDLRSFARDTSLSAGAGWDDATGLGTPWAPALVDSLG